MRSLLLALLCSCTLSAGAQTLTGIDPQCGTVGSLVHISGKGLAGATAVSFNGTPGLIINNSDTLLTGFVMPGTTTGAVSVTTPAGALVGGKFRVIQPNINLEAGEGDVLHGSDTTGKYWQGTSVAISADGTTALVGGAEPYSGGLINGSAWVFIKNNGNWVQQTRLVGDGVLDSNQGLGFSVALSADGNTAIIGDPTPNNVGGGAYVFVRNGSIWMQQGNRLGGKGYVVSLSADGNTAVSGDDNGVVFFRRDVAGTWVQETNNRTSASFLNLSADGNTLLVSSDNVAATVRRTGGVWDSQVTTLLDGSILDSNFNFSYRIYSTAINADGTVVALGFEQPGATKFEDRWGIFIFKKKGGVWEQKKYPGRGVYVGLDAAGDIVAWNESLNTGALLIDFTNDTTSNLLNFTSFYGAGSLNALAMSAGGATMIEGTIAQEYGYHGFATVSRSRCYVATPSIKSSNNGVVCRNTKDTLKVTGPKPLSDHTFKWYTSATATTPFAIDTIVVVSAGKWFVRATASACDATCLSDMDSITVLTGSDASPTVVALHGDGICVNARDTLKVTGPLPIKDYIFHWYGSATATIPLATDSVYLAGPGTWWVDAVPRSGVACTNVRASATVALVAPPKPPHIYVTGGLPNPAYFCTDYQLSFDVSYREDDVLYQAYFNGNPLYGPFGFPLGSLGRTYGVSTTGLAAGQSYPLVFKSYRGSCETDTTINIKIFSTPAPTVSAKHGYTACSGRPDTLIATGPLPISSYTFNWYDSPTSVNYVYRGPAYAAPVGTWYVDATAVAAPFCTSPRIAVTVNPAAGVNSGFTSQAPAVCSGEPATITLSNLISGQSYSLVQGASTLATIQGNGARGSFTIQPDLLNLGSNSFTIQVSNGCPPPASVPVSVTVNALPSASTIQYGPQGAEIISGETAVQFIVLGVSNAVAYLWDFGDGTSSNEASPAHTYAYGGSFTPTLKLSSKDNCTDLIRGPVIDVVEQEVLIPNAFTPNGDGVNDTYYITVPTTKSFEFKVYDRLGNLVYQSEDAKFEWSGKTLRGDACQVGVYGYILSATLFNGTEVNRRGSITLLR